ncbi:septal ring lytic transglycosylase RlpA family protein, partial [Photobacterium sp. R1]
TSNGEIYDMYSMTAAHKTLPLPSYVRVTNKNNGKSAIVRVNDRGPFHEGRIIDLSMAAATKLDVVGHGTAPVKIELLQMPKPESTA